MISAFMLLHPASQDLCPRSAFRSKHVTLRKIACGTTRPKKAELFEATDFQPNYSSLNSAIFETSVILTVSEHADRLIGTSNVAFVHSDITPRFSAIWSRISTILKDGNTSVGLTTPYSSGDFVIQDSDVLKPDLDPLFGTTFDWYVDVWESIKRIDPDIYQFAFDVRPQLIYSHQFACSRLIFDRLCDSLRSVLRCMRLCDVGLWTPHVFERLIALYLAKHSDRVVLTTAFWHRMSSKSTGDNAGLYGLRSFKYIKI